MRVCTPVDQGTAASRGEESSGEGGGDQAGEGAARARTAHGEHAGEAGEDAAQERSRENQTRERSTYCRLARCLAKLIDGRWVECRHSSCADDSPGNRFTSCFSMI